MTIRHLYIHIPYCSAKCPYCDFNSIAGRDDEFAAYIDALLREATTLRPGPYETVFIGGGTPSILPPPLLERLLVGLGQHITLAPGHEWTCEANPGSADAERFAILAAHGVNRLSIGVQSTHPQHLRWLGRGHSVAEAEACVREARRQVARVSADLIFGLPAQTDHDLQSDLTLYARQDLDHASVYHLAIEPGTIFAARAARGQLREIEEGRSAAQFALVHAGLEALGLLAYETANFARPGAACRHNLAYWHQRDYAAIGAGAVSTIAGQRCTREAHPARYIARIMAGGDAITQHEQLSPRDCLIETWMLGLRLQQGVALERLAAQGDRTERWRPLAEQLIAEDLLDETNGHLRLTARGRLLQDHVTRRLMPDPGFVLKSPQ